MLGLLLKEATQLGLRGDFFLGFPSATPSYLERYIGVVAVAEIVHEDVEGSWRKHPKWRALLGVFESEIVTSVDNETKQ